MRGYGLFGLLLSVVLLGCSGDGDQVMEAEVPAAEEELEENLTELAETGESLGSGGMILQEGVDSIRERDPAKADALQAELDDLMSATSPNVVRSKAQAMLDIL